MDKPLTIKDLLKCCEHEIALGHGDHTIMLSDDDEGNGYHYCWYAFTPAEEVMCDDESGDVVDYYGLDEDIAPVKKTVILG